MKPQSTKSPSRLAGKVALVLGCEDDSVTSLLLSLAEKGADIAFVCLSGLTYSILDMKEEIEMTGRVCLIITDDPYSQSFTERVIEKTMETFGRLDVFIDFSAQQGRLFEDDDGFPNLPMMAAALSQMALS